MTVTKYPTPEAVDKALSDDEPLLVLISFDGSEQKISVRVRGSADGMLKVFTDRSKPAVAELRILPSASWADFRTSFHPEPGIQPLFFVYTGSGTLDFSSFTIEKPGETAR